jgi:hypothetical protein
MITLLISAVWALSGRSCTQKWDSVNKFPVTRQLANGTTVMCSQLVRQPRIGVVNKLCLCNEGKWIPLSYGGGNGKVDIQFFGDILGAAKQLCALFKSVECIKRDAREAWYVRDDTDFTNVGNASSEMYIMTGLVEMETMYGEAKLVEERDLLDIVNGICKFIDDGAGTLPGLLPTNPVDGIFGWLGRLLDGLFDFIDIFKNGMFSGRTLYEKHVR